MPTFLNTSTPDFNGEFARFVRRKRQTESSVADTVKSIIDDVRQGGDAALRRHTLELDNHELDTDSLRIPDHRIRKAIDGINADDREALKLAAERIRRFHLRQRPAVQTWTDGTVAQLGWNWKPVQSVGIYVPGGLASYPSSVLMNAIPARVAGVRRIIMAAPAPFGEINPLVLLAASLAGIEAIFPLGGAQAIAAMALGTESIDSVDMIAGPGNAYVTAAKHQLFGTVGIDMIAGPSEVLVIADGSCEADWVALDLLAQAEHDPSAQAILVTTSDDFARRVCEALEARLRSLPRQDVAGASWEDFGAVIIVRGLEEAISLCNRIAPEHVEICTEDPEPLARKIRNGGAVFLGKWTPEAIGDYVAGPSHVLPTSGSARFTSGLSVLNFMKRTSLTGFGPEAIRQTGHAAVRLAEAEGLDAHALSVRVRLQALDGSRE